MDSRNRLALILLCALLWACERGPASPEPTALAEGEAIYRRECASCHGARLEGQPNWRVRRPDGKLPAPPHDASGHTWHHPKDQLFAIIKFGLVPPNAPPGYQSDMPAFGGRLSDRQIADVLAFIESRWPPEIHAHRGERFGRQ